MKTCAPIFSLLFSLLLPSFAAAQSPRYAVGATVQNFALTDRATGRPVNLEDLAGKVIFLEWFAWWCPYCQAAAAQIGPEIDDYYARRGGNANGVPVVHVLLNLQQGEETQTQGFLRAYGLESTLVLNDFNRAVANRFQPSGQPIFAIINGVAGSPSHRQWELLHSQLGYGQTQFPIADFRRAIDSVRPAASVATPPAITRQPVSQTVAAGGSVTFAVQATGSGPLFFQWRKEGADLAGATGSSLGLTNVQPSDAGSYTVVVTNAAGSAASASATLTVAPVLIGTAPANQSPDIGGTATFSVAVTGTASSYQWAKNGVAIAGATASSYTIGNVQPSDAGLYTVTLTAPTGPVTSQAAILAPATTRKVVGSAYEHTAGIRHPNGRFYDQLLLTGPAATFTADAGRVTRLSYVDLNDDIVQIEFSGAGALTIVLDGASGPAAPGNYNQPSVVYMKGHASLYVANAGTNTYVSSFTVGRLTAFDPTGAYDITKPAGGSNSPANNGNPIFKAGVAYDGIADLGLLAISSPTGRFGGILSANTHYWKDRGHAGIYAPDVTFDDGRVFFHDLSARDTAKPVLILGSASDVRVTGGDLRQDNGQAVEVHGLTQLRFTAGTDSHGTALPAQANRGRLVNRAGVDVTSQLATGG